MNKSFFKKNKEIIKLKIYVRMCKVGKYSRVNWIMGFGDMGNRGVPREKFEPLSRLKFVREKIFNPS